MSSGADEANPEGLLCAVLPEMLPNQTAATPTHVTEALEPMYVTLQNSGTDTPPAGQAISEEGFSDPETQLMEIEPGNEEPSTSVALRWLSNGLAMKSPNSR